MNFYPYKYFIKFPMAHLTAAASTTKLHLDFSSIDTVDLDMKEIGSGRIPSREFSNSHFPPSFSCASEFIVSSYTSAYKSTTTILSLNWSILMYNLIEGSGLAKVGPDKIYFFNRSSNIWFSRFHRFFISSIS